MFRLFSLLALLHGVIHLLGTVKAFQWAQVPQLTGTISRAAGITWSVSALLLFVAAGWMFFGNRWVWIPLLAGILLSQLLIWSQWSDAKWGTIVNLLLLIPLVGGWAHWNYQHTYRQDVQAAGALSPVYTEGVLTEKDVAVLPAPVQRYIRYSGCIGQPRVSSFRVQFTGRIRSKGGSWMPFTSEQQNFLYPPTRLFWMDATMKGLPVAGYHRYRNGIASMDIRLLSLLKVQYASGGEMNVAETITFFNDLCIMAPAALVDTRIRWEAVEGDTVKAAFTAANITVRATLIFAPDGRLMNFISDERFNTQEGKRMQWSTPLLHYAVIGKQRLGVSANLVYAYPEEDFVYGEFQMKSITYNP
jgi:hypothetical protein